jgi:tellurite resistance protein
MRSYVEDGRADIAAAPSRPAIVLAAKTGEASSSTDAQQSRSRRAHTSYRLTIPIVPASFFGMVLGLVGLGDAWRAATQIWGAPKLVGELIMLAGAIVWVVVLVLYSTKWIVARAAALAEARHPVQCCFIGLAGVATTLVALAALPYAREWARLLLAAGSMFTIGFALWRSGELWKGGRDIADNTPVLYLPAVTGGFVTATAAAALGHHEVGQLLFGAGFFSWLALESVLLHRLYSGTRMAVAMRPTLGIQLAPPAVGGLACINMGGDAAGFLPHAMLGYALLQGLLLVRLTPWICEQAFIPSYWGFAFGATALAGLTLRLPVHSDGLFGAALAPTIFAVANLVTVLLVLGTLRLLAAGRLLAEPLPVNRTAEHPAPIQA